MLSNTLISMVMEKKSSKSVQIIVKSNTLNSMVMKQNFGSGCEVWSDKSKKKIFFLILCSVKKVVPVQHLNVYGYRTKL